MDQINITIGERNIDILTAKYSVLLAGDSCTEKIKEEDITELLKKGIKVSIFSNRKKYIDYKKKLVNSNLFMAFKEGERGSKVDSFFNVYENKNNSQVLFIDGILYYAKFKNDDSEFTYNGEYDLDWCKEALNHLSKADVNFNYEQYNVEHMPCDSNIIVKAGAGSGKTKVMVDRVMYLLSTDEEFEFSKVCMITFTNKATDEMRHRLVQALQDKYKLTKNYFYLTKIEEFSQISLSTIHSFFRKIIAETGYALGYGTKVALNDFSEVKRQIIKELVDNSIEAEKDVLIEKHEIEKLILVYWTRLNNLGVHGDELKNLDFGDIDIDEEITEKEKLINLQDIIKKVLRRLESKYNNTKFKENAIGMEDIIYELKRLFDELDKNGKKLELSTKYKYMFCDEFQDCDEAQIEVMSKLRSVYDCSMFVVGDVKQSIYGFRGASEKAFSQFEDVENNNGAQYNQKLLSKNYRTEAVVMDEIDKIFKNLGEKKWKKDKFDSLDNAVSLLEYKSSSEEGDTDRLTAMRPTSGGEYKQYRVICKKEDGKYESSKESIARVLGPLLKKLRADAKEEIVCLTRTNNQISKVKEICDEYKIPCIIKTRGGFFQSHAVVDFCALIEYLYFGNIPMYEFNFKQTQYYKRNEHDNLDAYRRMLDTKPLMAVLRQIVEEISPASSITDKLEAALYEANLNKLLKILSDRSAGSMSSLQSMCLYLRSKIVTDRKEDIAELEDNSKKDLNPITACTVHSSKGLAFKNVVIPFMNEKLYPDYISDIVVDKTYGNKTGWVYRKKPDKKKIEHKNKYYADMEKAEVIRTAKEECRLLYVAMTRAQEGLYCLPFEYEKNNDEDGLIQKADSEKDFIIPTNWTGFLLEELTEDFQLDGMLGD